MPFTPLGAVALLLKSIAGGIICLLAAWIAILVTEFWKIKSDNARHGVAALGASAGGWSFLLRSPIVVLILSAAFGIGFYLAVRWSSRS